jgi:nucleoside phosphorylase
MRTVLLFAIPEEHAHFKKATGPWQLTHRTPFKTFLRTTPSRELVLMETGMGQKQLLEALHWLLLKTLPDLIVGAGFAGSLSEDLAVGDVCLGESYACLEEGVPALFCPEIAATPFQNAASGAWGSAAGESEAQPGITFSPESGAHDASRSMLFCRQYRLHGTRMVTVNQPQPKPLLARKFTDRASIMDMESYFAARFCYERRIPFLGIRAVSDGLRDEIDFDLNAISDGRGRVRIPLVMASVIKSPRLLMSYCHSWKRSRKAAGTLGRVLAELIALPTEELLALARPISYYKT